MFTRTVLFAAVAALIAPLAIPVATAADLRPIAAAEAPTPREGYEITVGERRFTLADIGALPQYEARMDTMWTDEGAFVGPKLADLLEAAGLDDFNVLYMEAANGYTVTVEKGDDGFGSALIAHSFEGAPLPLNEKGPFWLVWPTEAEAVIRGEALDSRWIWSVVNIQKAF